MALDKATFETITPSRFTNFTFPNPSSPSSLLHIAVLDSPFPLPSSSIVAAMLVPTHRQSDWIFSTHSGHLHLLLSSPNISRLILINGHDSPSSDASLAVSLKTLFLALCPKSSFRHGIPEIPLLIYEDNVISSVVLERCVGDLVGEMLVEDVEIEKKGGEGSEREFRRRLRFKRMPNLVQTEVRIVPVTGSGLNCSAGIGEVEFSRDDSVLVHTYLVAMVAGLMLIGTYIEGRVRSGIRPRALCLGVGGGALLGFLKDQLGFGVVGVESDEEVLRVARKYFGLDNDDENINICVGDALKVMDQFSCRGNGDGVDTKFDAVLVDLDSSDAGNGVIAPPVEFVRKHVLVAARSVLCDNGIFAMNVIPPNRSFYTALIHEFREVFEELYEIDVGNGENFILIGVASPVMSCTSDCENCFLKKLRMVISGAYLDSIKKI